MDTAKINLVISKLAEQMREAIAKKDAKDFVITEFNNNDGIITISVGYPAHKLIGAKEDDETESLIDILSNLSVASSSLSIGASARAILRGEDDESVIRAFELDVEHSEIDNTIKGRVLQGLRTAGDEVKNALRDVLQSIVEFIKPPIGAQQPGAANNTFSNTNSNASSVVSEASSEALSELEEEEGVRPIEHNIRPPTGPLAPIAEEEFEMMLHFEQGDEPLEHRIDVFKVEQIEGERVDGISFMNIFNNRVMYSRDECISLSVDKQEGETRIEKLNNLIGAIIRHIGIEQGAAERITIPSTFSELDYAGGPFDFIFNRLIVEKPEFANCSVISTIGDGTCLVHSFLISTCSNYRTIVNISDRGIIGRIIRKGVLPYLYLEEEVNNNEQEGETMDLIKSSRYLDDSFLEELCSYFSTKFIMFQEGRDMIGVSLFGTGPGDYYLMYGNNIGHHFSAIKNGGGFIITLPAAINPIGYNIRCDRLRGQQFNRPGDTKQYYIFKGGNFNEEGQCTQIMLFWAEPLTNDDDFVEMLLMDGAQPTRVPVTGEEAAGVPGAGEEAAGVPGAGEEAAGVPGAGEEAAGVPVAGEEAAGVPVAPAARPSKLQQYAANPTMFAQMITYIKRKRLEASVGGNEESVRGFNTTKAKLEQARRNYLSRQVAALPEEEA